MALAATFSAEPLLQPLELVLGEAGLHPSLHLAPYHQLFQQLLSPNSLLASHAGAANVVLIRLEDFVREVLEPADALSLIERTSRQLSAALLQFVRHSRSPLLVLLLPVSALRAEPLGEALRAATACLREQISMSASLHPIDVAQIDARCGRQSHDRLRDELAHIPYTEEYFSAMALVLAGRVHGLCMPGKTMPAAGLMSTTAVLEALRTRRRARPLRERAIQPASPLERELLVLWQELLNIEALGVEDNFFALGGTSLQAAHLCAQIARRCGVRLQPGVLVAAPTVRLLARALQNEQVVRPAQAASLLVELRAGGPQNLFLIHDADGETQLYRALAQRLSGPLSVYGVEPHRLPRVPLAAGSITQMAREYVAQIRGLQPQGPYQLGGLGAGAVIAYEMTQQLHAAGERVALLALMDAARPGTARRPAFLARQRLQQLWVKMRFALLRRRLAHGRPWPLRLPALAVREIYDSAEASYVPHPIAGPRVVLVRARARLGATIDTPSRFIYADEALGWRSVVADIEILDADGGHTSMLQEPHVMTLAAALTERLMPKIERDHDRAIAGSGTR